MLCKDDQFELFGLLRKFGPSPSVGKCDFGSGSVSIFRGAESHHCPLPLNFLEVGSTDPLLDLYRNFDATRPPKWLAEFDNALVLPPYNIVAFDATRVFSNSVRGSRFISCYFSFEPKGRLRLKQDYEVENISAEVVIIDTSERRNYFHWLIEVLPRYYFAIRMFGETRRYLFSDIDTSFQQESLKDFGKVNDNILLNGDRQKALLCQKALVPSLSSGSILNINSQINEYATFATSALKQEARSTGGVPFRRIYVSRADAAFRRVVNEDEIFPRLQAAFGFERVVLSELSFAEQKKLFFEASIVVSAHGAGLSNLIFCRSGASIVELTPKGHQHVSPFWSLSSYLGKCRYYLVRATVPDVDLSLGAQKVNFHADADVVLSLVDKIEGESKK